MFFTGTDYFEGDGAAATFHALIKSGGNGKLFVRVFASAGCSKRSPFRVDYNHASGTLHMGAKALATNPARGLVGIPAASIGVGSYGWIQVRGECTATGLQGSFTGSIGHAVYWGAADLGATASAYVGAEHQVGFLLTEYGGGGSNVGHMYLTGNMYAQSAAGF